VGQDSRHPQANASLDEEFTRNGELMSLRLIYLRVWLFWSEGQAASPRLSW
jgi:hypothetical protein